MKGGPKTFKQWAALNLDETAFKRLVSVVEYDGSQIDFIARADGIWDLGNEVSCVSPVERAVSWLKNRNILGCLRSARGIIYQSDFSKRCCETKWPFLCSKPNTIIPNPLASKRFGSVKWIGNRSKVKLKIVMFHRHTPMKASYLGAGFANSLREALGLEVELYVIGSIPKYIRRWYDSFDRLPWVKLIENNGADEFVRHVVDCDFVLNLAHFDPCPNVVLECVTIGVPIIAINSGGVPELLGCNYPYLLKPFFSKKSWLRRNKASEDSYSEFVSKVCKLRSVGFDPALYDYAHFNSNEDKVAMSYEKFILSLI